MLTPDLTEPYPQEQVAKDAVAEQRERQERERQEREQKEREQQEQRQRDLGRALNARYRRCDECPACEVAYHRAWGISRAALPCETWLSRKNYSSNERAALYKLLCDKRPQHTYGFASQEELHQYIQQSVLC